MEKAVNLSIETRIDPRFPLSRRELAAVCEIILDSLGLEGSTMSLTLLDDREIAGINAGFLGCTGPTNILSFPAAGDDDDAPVEEDEAYLGELALSVETLARETDMYGQNPVEHLARLLAHGILHLAGHDHGAVMDDLTDMAVGHVLPEFAEGEEQA